MKNTLMTNIKDESYKDEAYSLIKRTIQTINELEARTKLMKYIQFLNFKLPTKIEALVRRLL